MNIYDPEINTQPFIVFQSVKEMKNIEQEIKDRLCGMLNSSGGVILFNCIRSYEKILAEGIKMSEKEK